MLASLDPLLPWRFSPSTLTAALVAAELYGRGAGRIRSPAATRCRIVFYLGLLLVYSALQTSWDYYASHMLFVLRGRAMADACDCAGARCSCASSPRSGSYGF